MTVTAIVGMQWGDEAKGKIVDLLTPQYDYVVRFNGGSVTSDTSVLIDDGKKCNIVNIGDFVDQFYEGDEEDSKKINGFRTLGVVAPDNSIKDFKLSKISGVYRHKVNEIYEIKYNGGKIKLTADHSIFVYNKTTGKILSKKTLELKKGDVLISFPHKNMVGSHNTGNVYASWSPKSNQKIIKTEYRNNGSSRMISISDSILEVFGYYVAEGYASIRKRQRNEKYRKSPSTDYDLTFSFNSKEVELVSKIEDTLSHVFGEADPHIFSPKDEPTETCIRYCRKYPTLFFRNLFNSGAKEKKLPDFFFELTKDQFLEFFKAYLKGDGHIRKSGEIEVSTVSKQLAIQLNWLLNLHSIKSTITEKITKEKKAPQGHILKPTKLYTIRIGATVNPFLDNHTQNESFRFRKILKISKKRYSGFVYDLCGCDGEAFFGGASPILLHNSNAGHTIKFGDKKFGLHLVPSGVFHPEKIKVMGNGLVINPDTLLEEIGEVEKAGYSLKNLLISEKAHLVLPWHEELEAIAAGDAIGTTKRGIGPAYSDKASRNTALRIANLFEDDLKEKLSYIYESKKQIIKSHGKESQVNIEELYSKLKQFAKTIEPYVQDTTLTLNQAIEDKKNILLEGAQGVFLDIDHGTYPYVTSSNVSVGSACTGTGIPPNKINKIIGISKAYVTRVGKGPFPTELEDETGDKLREKGGEFGTTTGRPRRCGWLDIVMLKYSVMLNGTDELTITKIDVLDEFEELKVCVAYEVDGKQTKEFYPNIYKLEKVKPVYKTFKGWGKLTDEDWSKIKKTKELPKEMKEYLEFISKELNVKISILSFGPERTQTLFL